jgi:hypothetical protein
MWQTVKEIALQSAISERSAFRLADKMMRLGEWEYRFRKESNHWTREYRRKKKK